MELVEASGIIRQSYGVTPDSSSGKSTPDLKDSDSPPQASSLRPRPRSPTAPRLLTTTVPSRTLSKTSNLMKYPRTNAIFTTITMTLILVRIPHQEARGDIVLSRLPVPSRVASPPPPATTSRNLLMAAETSQKSHKLTRRPSGLMATPADMFERPFSPTFDAPHLVGPGFV